MGGEGYVCEVCGKQYKLETWLDKHLIEKHNYPLKESFDNGKLEYLMRCPNCGKLMPKTNIICWGCGYCLDTHIRVLAGLEGG